MNGLLEQFAVPICAEFLVLDAGKTMPLHIPDFGLNAAFGVAGGI